MRRVLNTIKGVFFISLLCSIPFLAAAQTGFEDDVSDVPIDGGLSILMAAGVGYVIHKVKKNKKNTNQH